MVDYADLCVKINELENTYKLFELEFNGIYYWKYARYYIYRILLNKFYGIHTPWLEQKNPSDIKKFSHLYQKLSDTIFHNINNSTSKDILMFTFNRRSKKGKYYVSAVTDEIALNLDLSNCIVEVPYNGGYYRPTPIKEIKYFDAWKGVGRNPELYTPITRGKLRKQILLAFEKEFAITFSLEEKNILLTNINYFLMYRQELMQNYERLIQKVHPRLVLYTTSYIGEWVVLTETLKQLKIPCIEILHGYVDHNYLPYNYLKEGMNDAQPDYIFVFSQIQKDQVHWGIPKENIRVVGYPEGEKRAKELLANPQKRKRKRITFISSMVHVIETYINILAENIDSEEYEILFKLHPNEYSCWEDIYTNLSDKVQIIDSNKEDIHFYLANSDIVIGINSTALFEATFYPVDIYILQEDSYQNMDYLIRSGNACLIQDDKELLTIILQQKQKNFKQNENIYKRNSIVNINTEIQKIVRR